MFVIIFLILQLQSPINQNLLDDARNNFLQVESLEVAELKADLWLESEDSIVQAYGACMYFMQAKYAKSPITKWSRFKKGKKELDRLIEENSKNIELRYLRFLFQTEMPEFLGYHKNKEEDFELILDQIDTVEMEDDLKCVILKNMSQVKNLSAMNKIEIDKKLEECS